ncbi:MAG: DNA methylase [Acetatifactor sp.]
MNKTYISIDLKSFYASVECVERGLDPLRTNLVVADAARTEKTICLAVSPSLKVYGIPGRARLFEVVQRVKEVNLERKAKGLEPIDYIAAVPRMALYMEYSTRIYNIYLKYVAPEDIHVYSVDEVFMDVTAYLNTYHMTARELAKTMIQDVYETTGITATAGIGTNLYLCKVAMDIEAKHVQADADGVRIACLDEESYRRKLWNHKPLTDFWRVGRGYARKLEEVGLFTMGDVARCSLGKPGDFYNEDLLYRLFGINAELLIDHAWGYEPVEIKDIKAYRPESNSISSGQVLQHPYNYEKTRLIVREMTELLALNLVDKGLVTDQLVLTIGYDIENLKDETIKKAYAGDVTTDHYGRRVPKHAHGSINLPRQTASTRLMMEAVMELFERIMNPALLSRRINLTANHVIPEKDVKPVEETFEQMDLFTDYGAREKKRQQEEAELAKEKKMQKAVLDIQKKFGKNAVLKGMNLQEGGTTIERNGQVGGHRA